MNDLDFIYQAAEKIKQQLISGDVAEACGMTAMPTLVTESWEVAQQLAENANLTSAQQLALLMAMEPNVQQQMRTRGFDDFDLIYERLLQLVFSSG